MSKIAQSVDAARSDAQSVPRSVDDSVTQSLRLLNQLVVLSLGDAPLDDTLAQALDIILASQWLGEQPVGAIFVTDPDGETLRLACQRRLDRPLVALCDRVAFGRCICGRAASTRTLQQAACLVDAHENGFPGMAEHGHCTAPITLGDEVVGVLNLYVPHGRVCQTHELAFVDSAAAVLASMIQRARTRATLARARESSQRATAAKNRFLSHMSHELRTPMNGVVGMIQLLGDTQLSAQQRDFVRTLRSSSTTMMRIVNDVLDLSKIESDKLVVEHAPFDLLDLVHDIMRPIEHRATDRSIEAVWHIDVGVPDQVVGDSLRIRQILSNLLENALKFTENGEIELRVSLTGDRSMAASKRTRNGSKWVRFDVIDSGIGIAPEAIEHLFQPYTQADGSIARRFGGTGLGLAIAHKLATALGGQLSLHSELDVGSTFTLTLPVHLGEPMDRRPTTVSGHTFMPVVAGKRVLVAEDDPVSQKVARHMLERLGYEVHLVADGAQAVAAVSASHYAAVLMDCRMPELDGFSATRRIRAQGHTVPIIALTGSAMAADVTQCIAAGMDAHMAKPVDMAQLRKLLLKFV